MEARVDTGRKSALLSGAVKREAVGTAPDLLRRMRPGEEIIRALLFICGVVSIFTTLGILFVLFTESRLVLSDPNFNIINFLTGTTWQPRAAQFGILPLVTATLMTSLIAMLVAIPLGLSAAIYLSEYASPRARASLKPILEVLAGVPTVVYGFFALQTISPFIRNLLGPDVVQFQNMLSAGLVMGFMILPTITSVSEDALSAVPRSLREASVGLGATKFETTTKVVVPAALSGIVAAFILGVSRAVGETMIVALAAGGGPNFTLNPLRSAETMTGHIVRISGGELSYNSIEYNSLFIIGLMLFFITLTLNVISNAVIRRFREVYQ
ncbi:MAG: phosphate ABC transporter permease subunit PstC [Anaerolineae bacterium]|nr:phosphate ABC transporter permease subunit PstC [Anaerolineae bacterium]